MTILAPINTNKLRHSRVVVDLEALRFNYQLLKKSAPNSQCIAVVKADAYGHGAVEVAKALSGNIKADAFAVATVPEAIQLREANIQQKILVLGGFVDEDEMLLALEHQLDCVVHSQYQIDLLLIAGCITLNVWIKVNTGMGRLGFNLDDVSDVLHQLSAFKIVSMMTHLASADDVNNDKTEQQYQQVQGLGLDRYDWSISNSAGTLAWPKCRQTWVRFGIALYGVNPFDKASELSKQLKPVMRFESQLVAIYNRHKGDSVGYSSTFNCKNDMKIGVIGAGYADGYPRHIDQSAWVSINDVKLPIIGRVSMDMITVDLTQADSPNIGDVVTLWHKNPTVEQIAISSGTIGYELCCNAGAHAPVEYE